jgi:chemotaxis protein MotB
MAQKVTPIIVIKKKGGHGGHHGGAWKVAYADFVTAMMALFIVLWLMSQSEKVKKAVAGYFNDPKGTAQLLGTTMSGNGESVVEDQANKQMLQELKEKLLKEIEANKALEKLLKQIEITITPEGLRIELLESKNGTFYQSGSAQLSASGQELLALLAKELKTLPNQLLIEGHTDATPYATSGSYSNWELSADRANAARRLLQLSGVRADQVTQVRGYADQFLRVKSNPFDSSNRRISILVKNTAAGAMPEVPKGAEVAEGAATATPSQTEKQTAAQEVVPKPTPAAPAKTNPTSRVAGLLPGKKK